MSSGCCAEIGGEGESLMKPCCGGDEDGKLEAGAAENYQTQSSSSSSTSSTTKASFLSGTLNRLLTRTSKGPIQDPSPRSAGTY